MAFKLKEEHLVKLFKAANFSVPNDEMVFVGLRGCVPLMSGGTDFADNHMLEYLGTDHVHLRCTIAQWRPGNGLAVFPASTVPYIDQIKAAVKKGGSGTNMLALGYFHGRHGYTKGDHGLSRPASRHRAFRNESFLPLWRTADDADYEGDDLFQTHTVPYDNIHCAWQQNASANWFSSNGCQVIVGRPRVIAKGWNAELGPWATFVDNAYALSQSRFNYALFSGREVAAAASLSDTHPPQTVRFGSSGELVELVQDALMKHGYDIGPAGADGDLGLGTVMAISRFQKAHFGAQSIDLIVGHQTAGQLGLKWPAVGQPNPAYLDAADLEDTSPGTMMHPASASGNGGAKTEAKPNYRSLVNGGYFSKDPFDLSQKRSLRTNNPGALNITAWQVNFAGYVGKTQPDFAGNETTIYVTPEHGIGAWHYLLTDRYGYGATGSMRLAELARKYAGVPTEDHPAVAGYVKGWRKWSVNALDGNTVVKLDNDSDMLLLAKGMFGHEAGEKSPLLDAQIKEALKLKRSGKLPAS